MSERDRLVNIIVPVYNVLEYISKCVESILVQSYRRIEIILVDDGSTDGSGDKCEEFALKDKRVVVIHQDNSGVVTARKIGIQRARGVYISFVDADDWIEPDMIEKLVDRIGEADVISAGVDWEEKRGYHITKKDLFSGTFRSDSKRGMDEIYRRMIYDLENDIPKPLTTWMWNKLYKKELVTRTYSIVDKKVTFSEDTIFIYGLYLNCSSAVFVDDVVYHYCYRENSACHPKDSEMPQKVGQVYSILFQHLMGIDNEYLLVAQLRRWLLDQYYKVLNERTGIDASSGRVIRYFMNTDSLKDKRIVIYGAGRVGQDLSYLFFKEGINVVAWIDKRYEEYIDNSLPVERIERLSEISYDNIVVALENRRISDQIKIELMRRDIEEGKIIQPDFIKTF